MDFSAVERETQQVRSVLLAFIDIHFDANRVGCL
jgi:hypothetical protein